jgi:hypothetical protein
MVSNYQECLRLIGEIKPHHSNLSKLTESTPYMRLNKQQKKEIKALFLKQTLKKNARRNRQ